MEQINITQQNSLQRAAVLGQSQKMTQRIGSQVIDPSADPVITFQPRNVGLVLGFIIEVSGGVTNGATNAATRTGFGSANAVRNFTFTDLNNVQRINTSGSHMAMLNAARQGFVFGGAYAPNIPMGYGSNYTPFEGPATLDADGTGTVRHTYYVPLAYSSMDLRGAIYANVVNANMQLQVTVNATPFVGATDPLNAIYSGNANGAWTDDVTVTVYQVYLDQIPVINNNPVLPILDLNTIYDIKYTALNGLVEGQDYPVAYANFRAFLSTFVTYDNGGSYNGGTDIDYFSLTSANSTNLFKYSPNIAALMARQTFMADLPAGSYYFDHREKPLDTITYGNLELNVNPLTVNANAQLLVGFESFQQINQIPLASSLAAG